MSFDPAANIPFRWSTASVAERTKAIESALATDERPQVAAHLARRFQRAKPADVEEILHTLAPLSRAHESDTTGANVR